MIALRTHRLTLGVLLVGAAIGTPLPAQQSPERLPLRPARTIVFETTEGTFMNVDLSPDGQTIVFDLLGDLYTLPIAGGRATQLTRGLAWETQPVWSPDGKRIAFVSDGTGSDQLWLIGADGRHARPLTPEPNNDLDHNLFFDPEWTPDGRSLVSGRYLYDLAGGKVPLPAPLVAPAHPANDDLHGALRFSPDGRYIYFDSSGVRRYDRTTGVTVQLARPPMRYSRPVVSPDGQWLAYVTDVDGILDPNGSYNGLRVRNLETGEDRWLVHPIDSWRQRWEQRYVFTPDSKALIMGFGGKLHRLDVTTGKDEIIPFTAAVHVELGPFVYHQTRLQNDSLHVRYTRSAQTSPDGTTLVFSALSRLYTMALPNGLPTPLVAQSAGQFQPVYSPDGRWIAYVTWSDVDGGHLWRVPAGGGEPQRLTSVAGYYQRPAWSPDGTTLAVVKGSAAELRNWAAQSVGVLQLVPSGGGEARTVADDVPLDNQLTFTPGGQRLVFMGKTASGWVRPLYSMRTDGGNRRTLASVAGFWQAEQVVPSPDGRYFAYLSRGNLYLAARPLTMEEFRLGHGATVRMVQLTHGDARDPRWEQGGTRLTWVAANRFYRLDPERALTAEVGAAIAPDDTVTIHLTVPRHTARGTLALTGARVITMRGDEVLDNATVVITDDRIAAVGPSRTVRIPQGATVFDMRGKTIMPGLVEMHAHTGPPRDVFVQNYWELLASFAYGVTTVRDPSTSVDGYGYSELIEAGRMVGPRLFPSPVLNSDDSLIHSLDDARRYVRHQQTMGATFIKVWDWFTREQRQWMVMAAREAGLNITGHPDKINLRGWRLNLSIVLDGFTGWEHNLKIGTLYADVRRLVAEAGTWYTPALNRGQYFRYRDRLRWIAEPKIRRFWPARQRDEHLRRGLSRPTPQALPFWNAAVDAARMRRLGAHVTMGSHGDDDGLGSHWELWALQLGGLTPHEALRTATILGAEGLGMQRDLGSIEVGKLADLLVLDQNPLENIEHTLSIRYVMKNGILYDDDTLAALWPDALWPDALWPEKRPPPAWMYRETQPRVARQGHAPEPHDRAPPAHANIW